MLDFLSKRRSRLDDIEGFERSLPLYYYNDHDAHTISDALQHVCVLGRTGAGKSSGPGKAFAVSYLAAGFGGLILCAKGEERFTWERYAEEAGRKDDVVVFNPSEVWRFNFFDYEHKRSGRGGGSTVNLHRLLVTIVESIQGTEDGGGGDNAYWQYTMDQLIRRSIDLLLLSGEEPTLQKIYDVVASAPQEATYTAKLNKEKHEGTPAWHWQSTSYCFGRMIAGMKRYNAGQMDERESRDWRITVNYWRQEFPTLSNRTRSVIVSYMTSTLDLLLTGDLGELFGTRTNITPEACFDGAIIIVDLPTLEYFDLGKMAAGIWKYMLQRAVLAREVHKDTRPVFLWADEAHQFLSSYDQEYMAQCRSKGGAVVYLVQNIPQFKNALGGGGMERVNSLIGNFKTLVFMANNENDTNQYAADIIGKSWMVHPTINMSSSRPSDDEYVPRVGANLHQSERYGIQPNEFTALRTGGPHNDWMVEAIVFRGERWSDDASFLRVYFAQR